jgi:hypothetical protein
LIKLIIAELRCHGRIVLRPPAVARRVRHNAGGNLNGGVNRVGVRR